MATKGKKRQVLFTVDNLDHFHEKVNIENKKLICVDTHLAWCGRCESMEQNYRSLFLELNENFDRMEFFSAPEEYVPEDILAGLKFGPLTCKPRFLLFVEGQKMDEIDGADLTMLQASLSKHIPKDDD